MTFFKNYNFNSSKSIIAIIRSLRRVLMGAFGISLLLLLSCGHSATVPQSFAEVSDSVHIYPNYRDVTIPPNIAPLNFMVIDSTAEAFVADVNGIVCGAKKNGKIDIDTTAWRALLTEHRGKDIKVLVYACREQGWVRHPAFTIHVAKEEIDPYVTYRLIEPGYELYQQLGIYQRNLTNFEVTTIYENGRDHDSENTHCISCHNFQNNDANKMYLHVRENHKGTVFTNGKEAHKIIIKHDSIIASGAYGKWNPRFPFVAYSTNRTEQVFHLNYPEKIEVYDGRSDLLLYDVENNVVSHILRTPDYFETFPCWSPDGTRMYYCSARLPQFEYTDFEASLVMRYNKLLYDIYSMPFDTVTHTFGEPRLEVNASAMGLSCSVPRITPDGRYLSYALAEYGQFHLYHKSSDFWMKDLTQTYESQLPTDNSYPLIATNSGNSESYHTWSSNSRWIVFSTRRDDNDFTRSYIAYIDSLGQGHRAFLLPQRDPEYNLLLLKSFNVPELTYNAIQVSRSTMEHVILHTEAELATYK